MHPPSKRSRSEIKNPPPPMPISDPESKISQYELSREERIRENRERMGKLGIPDISHSLKLITTPPSRRTPSNPKSLLPRNPSSPSRRSSRLQNIAPVFVVGLGEDVKRSNKSGDEVVKRKGGGGFLLPLQLSDALAKFFGESELSRIEVVKRMWDYIKGNNLQDPSKRRQILCDEKLKELFGIDSFDGFTVSKLLVPHFIKK
ncbi:unnamed protein product [Vicia faba]|uniref:SWIB domain-containing protein n=1 Tax=Vicia faba TaxID=3906 RepID=A0AAV1B5E9_VICFA|nr:unnamed protein product [Vicia faba]